MPQPLVTPLGGIWAAPVCLGESDVAGVLSLQRQAVPAAAQMQDDWAKEPPRLLEPFGW
jgi:hypothetical protein